MHPLPFHAVRSLTLLGGVLLILGLSNDLPAQFERATQVETKVSSEELRRLVFGMEEEAASPADQPQFSRRASSVLRGMAEELSKQAPPKQPPENAAPKDGDAEILQQLTGLIQSGEWAKAQEQFAKQPQETAAEIYTGLLATLAGDPFASVSPDEFLPLADLSPVELAEEELQLLGEIFKRIAAQTESPNVLLNQLRGHNGRLGVASESTKRATARLLLTAGRLDDVADYLPDFESVLKSDDSVWLNLRAEYHLAKSQSQEVLGEWQKVDNLFEVLGVEVESTPSDPNLEEVLKSWQLTVKALAVDEHDSAALERANALLLDVSEDMVSKWLVEIFPSQRAIGFRLLATAAEQAEMRFGEAPPVRTETMRRQQLLVTALLMQPPEKMTPGYKFALRLLAWTWIREAQKSAGGNLHQIKLPKDEEIAPIPRKLLLVLAPNALWIESLDTDTARHVRHLIGVLAAQTGDQEQTFAAIRLFAEQDPRLASDLADRLLASWTNRITGNNEESASNDGTQSSIFGGLAGHQQLLWHSHAVQQTEEPAVSLTRAKQARNLKLLAKLLADLHAAGAVIQDQAKIAEAFAACHSPAEIFRMEDIRDVLGGPNRFSPELAGALFSVMREKLANQWRSPELQEEEKTQRTDAELIAEIERGYQLVETAVTEGMERNPENQKLRVLLATALFDRAEFLYGQKVDLKTYVGLRDQSFGLYRDAARQYAAQVRKGEVATPSIDIFWQWFQSSLGASDLAYLTRQDAPEQDQIEEIAAMLKGLDGETAKEHLALFGERLSNSQGNVPAALRPNYLREGVRIVGDHPSGKLARERLTYFEELLSEVQLALEVDGPTDVGLDQPFGVRIAIRNSTTVGAEGGALYGLAELAGSELDPVKNLEEQLKERLGEMFHLDVLRFQTGQMVPAGFGRPGWRQTSLGYLVLRAKDPSVDRIPSISVDLPFRDTNDYVMLPIASSVVLIDARGETPPTRELQNLAIGQILDDRKLLEKEGLIQLEISATATGLLPDLEQIVDLSPVTTAGFDMARTVDHGLDITALDSTGPAMLPQSRRSWTLELKPQSQSLPEEFLFPIALESSATMTLERYADADLVKTKDRVALPAAASSLWLWVGIGSGLSLLGLGLVVYLVYRSKRKAVPQASTYRRPDRLTPFSAVSFLQKVHGDQSLPLSETEREELARTVAQLQEEYFRTNGSKPPDGELNVLFQRWLARLDSGSHSRNGQNGNQPATNSRAGQ